MARMILDCVDPRWVCRAPQADWVGWARAFKARQPAFQALPALRGLRAEVVLDLAAAVRAGGGGGGGFGGGGRGGGGFGGPGGRNRPGGNGNGRLIGNRRNRGRQGIHGNLSLQWQGSDTDAKQFSISGQREPQPNFNNYRWSGVVGGPLRIPHLLKGDSTFFTVSYYSTRGQSVSYNVGSVPTATERLGNFSDTVVNGVVPTIYNPTTGAPFAGNVIPSSLLNPAALGLLQYVPLPNLPGVVNNYEFITAVPADTDNVSVRLNQNLGKNDRLALTEGFQRRKSDTAQLFGFLGSRQWYRQQHESELGSQRRPERP